MTACTTHRIRTRSWLQQHEAVVHLNLLAHKSVVENTDDAGLAAALVQGKLPALVAQLLAVEAWREHVLPELLPMLVEAVDIVDAGALNIMADAPLQIYATLFHEATIVNLLESWCYHDYAVEVRASCDLVTIAS